MLQSFLTKSGLICVLFILMFIFLKIFGPIPLFINSVSTNKIDVFTVTGEGSATSAPDIANITVGVQATGSTVKQAQDQINTNINKISQAIKNLGISSADIQTTEYDINPNFNQDQKISGFSANTSLAVKIRDLNNVNNVIDAATTNGSTNISGVSFDIDDKSKLEDQARQMAVDQAKKKADQAAKSAGFRLGRIINYTENTPGIEPLTMANPITPGSVLAKTQIQTGSTMVKITVSLSYEII